jgi:hypothetical protein
MIKSELHFVENRSNTESKNIKIKFDSEHLALTHAISSKAIN